MFLHKNNSNAKPSLAVICAVTAGLLLCLGLVTLPRFNRQDVSILRTTLVGRDAAGMPTMGDAPEYINMVRFFRGEISRLELTTPFAYRPAVPFLAALLPVKDAMTALNGVNLAALVLALFFIHGTMRTLGYGFWDASAGDVVFVFSFPVFYYGTVGLVDPVWIAVLVGGLYLLYQQRWIALCGMVVLGALVRETTIVLIPVVAAYLLVRRPAKGWLTLAAVAFAYILPTIMIRMLFDDLEHYGWHPSTVYLRQNLRLRMVAALVLSFGLPGLLMVLWLARKRWRGLAASLDVVVPMLVGVACGIGLSAFAVVAAYADGRFMWAASLFAMPFCLDVIRVCYARCGMHRERSRSAPLR